MRAIEKGDKKASRYETKDTAVFRKFFQDLFGRFETFLVLLVLILTLPSEFSDHPGTC